MIFEHCPHHGHASVVCLLQTSAGQHVGTLLLPLLPVIWQRSCNPGLTMAGQSLQRQLLSLATLHQWGQPMRYLTSFVGSVIST